MMGSKFQHLKPLRIHSNNVWIVAEIEKQKGLASSLRASWSFPRTPPLNYCIRVFILQTFKSQTICSAPSNWTIPNESIYSYIFSEVHSNTLLNKVRTCLFVCVCVIFSFLQESFDCCVEIKLKVVVEGAKVGSGKNISGSLDGR